MCLIQTLTGCAEVSRLETNRETIFEAIRVSFAAAYDALVLDPADRVSAVFSVHAVVRAQCALCVCTCCNNCILPRNIQHIIIFLG